MTVKDAIDLLRKQGYKMTERRVDILRYFENEENKYKTARDLYEYMEERYPGISFDTVYRNLHLYHELEILESTELDAEKHFRMTCSDNHHHHFICKTCGIAKKINFCPMDYIAKFLSQYKVDDHKFEVYGFCPSCTAS